MYVLKIVIKVVRIFFSDNFESIYLENNISQNFSVYYMKNNLKSKLPNSTRNRR